MCDYSLHLIASRPARVGDKLVTTRFPDTITRGFASVDEPELAVCLLPGTELAFEKEVQCEGIVLSRRLGHAVAKCRRVNVDEFVQRPTRERIATTGQREWPVRRHATAKVAHDVVGGHHP
jgi:hypothetical protein